MNTIEGITLLTQPDLMADKLYNTGMTPYDEGSEDCKFLSTLDGVQLFFNKALSVAEIKEIRGHFIERGAMEPNGYMLPGWPEKASRKILSMFGFNGRLAEVGLDDRLVYNPIDLQIKAYSESLERWLSEINYLVECRQLPHGRHFRCCHPDGTLWADPWPGLDMVDRSPISSRTALCIIFDKEY